MSEPKLARSQTPARLTSLFLCAIMTCAFGCGEARKPVVPVKVQVLVDGQPYAGVQVRLHSTTTEATESLQPFGQTDEQGFAVLATYGKADGAPVGSYRVTVRLFRAYAPDRRRPEDTETANVLPARYAQGDTTDLTLTVAKGTKDYPIVAVASR